MKQHGGAAIGPSGGETKSPMSLPAQKSVPSALRTAARSVSSASSIWAPSTTETYMALVMAFFLVGRFNLISMTAPSWLISTLPIRIRLPPATRLERGP
jgi:hypothetical protein